MTTMQQLSDCGINPLAVQLLWESWARHKTSPRHSITFPFKDSVITIQPLEEYLEQHKPTTKPETVSGS